MRPRAIGYVRVSTSSQAIDGVSLDAQRERIASWCESNGYRLVETFADKGISGKRADNRPGLQRALKAVCAKRGAALVVYSLSRLARSTKDAISIGERLDKAGADLVSLSGAVRRRGFGFGDYGLAAFTIAVIPALTGPGSFGHAAITSASSPSMTLGGLCSGTAFELSALPFSGSLVQAVVQASESGSITRLSTEACDG